MRFYSVEDFKSAVEQILTRNNGTISVSELQNLVPIGTPNTWRNSYSHISFGFKYAFTIGDKHIEVKWHSADPDAARLYPGCNSGRGWTAQIRIGYKLIRYDTLNWTRNARNETHIPLR